MGHSTNRVTWLGVALSIIGFWSQWWQIKINVYCLFFLLSSKKCIQHNLWYSKKTPIMGVCHFVDFRCTVSYCYVQVYCTWYYPGFIVVPHAEVYLRLCRYEPTQRFAKKIWPFFIWRSKSELRTTQFSQKMPLPLQLLGIEKMKCQGVSTFALYLLCLWKVNPSSSISIR